MTWRLRFKKSASNDVQETASYYEDNEEGLGSRLLEDMELITNNLSNNPLMYRVVFKEYRRANLHKFPYAVNYKINQKTAWGIYRPPSIARVMEDQSKAYLRHLLLAKVCNYQPA